MNPAFFKILAARVERLEKNLATAEERLKALETAQTADDQRAEGLAEVLKRGPGRPRKTE